MRHVIALLVLLILALPPRAQAQLADVICDDSARLERQLKSMNNARKQGHGMRGPDALLEIWVSASSGDWTLVQVYANGTSCIVAMGEHWESAGATNDPA